MPLGATIEPVAKKRRHHALRRRRTSLGATRVQVDPNAPKPVVSIIGYGPAGVEEHSGFDVKVAAEFRHRWAVTWIHVIGLGDANILHQLAELFHIHPLALAAIPHNQERPKVERYGETLHVVVRIVDSIGSPATEQLSVFCGPKFVISFEERMGDIFEPLRERIRERGRVYEPASDFLLYGILDGAIDAFFPVVETINDELEDIEELIPQAKPLALTPRLRTVKHHLIELRRALWPMREVMGALSTQDAAPIRPETRAYLRDCQDHCAQLLDIIASNRELATDLADLQLSVAGQRLNEVMKVLTIMATVFIPLTFISGIYGMNFDASVSPLNMPELRWYWGYPFALGIMLATALGLLYFFRRKGWL